MTRFPRGLSLKYRFCLFGANTRLRLILEFTNSEQVKFMISVLVLQVIYVSLCISATHTSEKNSLQTICDIMVGIVTSGSLLWSRYSREFLEFRPREGFDEWYNGTYFVTRFRTRSWFISRFWISWYLLVCLLVCPKETGSLSLSYYLFLLSFPHWTRQIRILPSLLFAHFWHSPLRSYDRHATPRTIAERREHWTDERGSLASRISRTRSNACIRSFAEGSRSFWCGASYQRELSLNGLIVSLFSSLRRTVSMYVS